MLSWPQILTRKVARRAVLEKLCFVSAGALPALGAASSHCRRNFKGMRKRTALLSQRRLGWHCVALDVLLLLLGACSRRVAEKVPDLSERICFDCKDTGQLQHGTTAAHSALTQPAAGKAWLAVGDAALSFDPLSSQGIFNALYTGLAAAESVHRFLQSEISSFAEYQEQLEEIRAAYERHLQAWYRSEKRWSEEEFWQGR